MWGILCDVVTEIQSIKDVVASQRQPEDNALTKAEIVKADRAGSNVWELRKEFDIAVLLNNILLKYDPHDVGPQMDKYLKEYIQSCVDNSTELFKAKADVIYDNADVAPLEVLIKKNEKFMTYARSELSQNIGMISAALEGTKDELKTRTLILSLLCYFGVVIGIVLSTAGHLIARDGELPEVKL